jgi:CheY-like chemotaxis protein
LKPKILVVEDNKDLLFNLELILKSNNYEPVLAKNGKEAIKKLSNLKVIPDLIISDILMPQMNGYQFFKELSNNPTWNKIPFIFLTARVAPKEVRLGKLLGADDYITKPFDEKDLLASINGRLERIKRITAIEDHLLVNQRSIKQVTQIQESENAVVLILVFWDDKLGPDLKDHYPREKGFQISLENISNQLFSVATSIYGQNQITKAEGALLKVANLKISAYLFFDAYLEEKERFGEKQYMLAVLAPKISYFQSLEIKRLLFDLSEKIKKKEKWNLKVYWKSISDLLQESLQIFK